MAIEKSEARPLLSLTLLYILLCLGCIAMVVLGILALIPISPPFEQRSIVAGVCLTVLGVVGPALVIIFCGVGLATAVLFEEAGAERHL
ncbi:hypothetical protein MVEN_00080500 [Mycena venus]|uniref:Transmembrane protein n=1 Tax=Mycena venus TaxID=2733690 RepID=A0A8H6Z7C1_9AGAR|nr:hypothetical protein MVEN_00080500 [Mycena venus]